MLRVVALGILATAVSAQNPNVQNLLSQEWRVRNNTARALASAAPVPVEELLEVLRTDWEGHIPGRGRFGGRGGQFRSNDPRQSVLEKARETFVRASYAWVDEDELPRGTEDLDVPWSPHDLALWLLLRTNPEDVEVSLAPDSGLLARAWLHLRQPDDALLQRACTDDGRALHVLRALWAAGDGGRQRARALDLSKNVHVRHARLKLYDERLAENPRTIEFVAEQAMHDESERQRLHAGGLLLDHPAPAAVALAPHCSSPDATVRTRALGLLCQLGFHAKPAAAALLTANEMPRTDKRYALVALASIDIPREHRARAAEMAFGILENDRQRTHKLLALDALANCSTGVTETMRKRLIDMIENPIAGGLKARVLACLQHLELADSIDLETRAYVTKTVHATTATWCAVAEAGVEAEEAVTAVLGQPDMRTSAIDKQAVINHYAVCAPEVVQRWLDDDRMQAFALDALRENGTNVPSEKLVELFLGHNRIAWSALEWLAERDDARQFADQVIAGIVEKLADKDRLFRGAEEYLKASGKTTDELITLLDPLLRRNVGWDAFPDDAARPLKAACRTFLAATNDPDRQDQLTARLCRLGLEQEDVERVRTVLKSSERSRVLWALEDAPALPKPLRADLVAIFDEKVPDMYWDDDWYARAALRNHR